MTFEVIQGDAIETMRGIPDGSIDCVLCDPPYGTTACSWDSVIPFAPMWEQLKRVVKKNGAIVLFGSQPFTSALVMSNPQMFRYEWVWRKSMATGHLNAHIRPMLNHEAICVFCREIEVFNPQELKQYNRVNTRGGNGENYGASGLVNFQEFTNYPRTVLDFNVHRSTDQHPTQKPLQLMCYLTRTYTNEGDTVLDFTCGSGTTGVACAIENRNFIGIEQDPHYCDVARARIARAQGRPADIPRRESTKDYPLFGAPLMEALS